MCDKKLEFISISFESEKKARDSLESVSSLISSFFAGLIKTINNLEFFGIHNTHEKYLTDHQTLMRSTASE